MPSADHDSLGIGVEIARLEEFVAVLRREQELLQRGESDPLLALIDSKNGLANALATSSRTRDRQLAAEGLPAGRSGIDAWLQRCGTDTDRRNWSRLLELAATARELNDLNGRLIGLHMQHNQQALATLMAAANLATTYGPDGQQQTAGGGRSLGKA